MASLGVGSALQVVAPRTNWRAEWADAYKSVADLVAAGLLTAAEGDALQTVAAQYRISVPRYYAGLIDRDAGDRCPIRRQAIPSASEHDPVLPAWARAWSLQVYGREVPWHDDPIGDIARLAAPRLTHRYGNRAIMHVSAACALYCRFCFRKSHLNDDERTLYDGSLDPALAYIAAHPEINELILTGGDPLAMPDGWLEKFFAKVEAIPHVRQVRVHSRMAATMPSRLTPRLGELLTQRRFMGALVSHFNHPRELTPYAIAQLTALRQRGVPLYNQAVLMRGINNDVNTLHALFEGLYHQGITPFYLHHADWTPGTFHFRTSIAQGRALMESLAGRLAGPAMPHYVLDVPGGVGKVNLLRGDVRVEAQHAAADISGAIYALPLPATRLGAGGAAPYLDLWPSS